MNKKWTTEEKAFLTMHLNKKPKQIVKRFHTKFGESRTYQSIYSMAASLRKNVLKQPLKKNSMKVSIKKPVKSRKSRKTGYSAKRWTKNEDNYLSEISSLDELEPCEIYETISSLETPIFDRRNTAWLSFSEKIATRIFIGFTTPLPDD